MQPYVLEGAELRLDQAGTDDVVAIAAYCRDPIFERFLTLPWPYSLGDARYFVDEHIPRGWAAGGEFTWAIRTAAGAPLLGIIGFRTARSDLGFWLGAPHRGQGIMPQAARMVTAHVLGAGLPGITAIRWECLVGNTASLAVARKCGFTFAGTKPAHVAARDGSHPESWHAVLRLGDDLEPKPGWPDLAHDIDGGIAAAAIAADNPGDVRS